ncbi:MAG: hypothetical protein EZS28_002327, partial [Streblomastix strix]
DFWAFGDLKNKMKGVTFHDRAEIEREYQQLGKLCQRAELDPLKLRK